MLLNLHVKNLAIIDEIDVDFKEHLNILTGETGAGKSILVGSVNIALGARVSADMIRKGADYAMVELVFQVENQSTVKKLKGMDIFPEDGQIVISRKIMENRSVNKINGESVSIATIKKVAALCIDIHGQHEHQSLLQKQRHLEIVDEYGGEELAGLLKELADKFLEYKNIEKDLLDNQIPEEERLRQLSFLQFEQEEIIGAKLTENEEAELEAEYQRLSHAEHIVQSLSLAYEMTGSSRGASDSISRALQEVSSVSKYDDQVQNFASQLQEIENLLSDFNQDVSQYMGEYGFDEQRFREVEDRLNQIRTVMAKYGNTYESTMNYLEEVEAKLAKYEDYDAFVAKKTEELALVKEKVQSLAKKISKIRKEKAGVLERQITEALQELNFVDAIFKIEVKPLSECQKNGMDDIEFMIATNPGEDVKPLAKIASGGELSRVMLAIKSVFADTDEIETLIFDEIDVGISGRTAQMVSEKMSVIGKKHQVICITHLAQIAAMADTHFVIQKVVNEGRAMTEILPLSEDDSIQELARIIGGAEITDTVLQSAREMKELAQQMK